MKPITALRVLTTAAAIFLVAALFLPKANGFLVGMALGLNISVLVLVWGKQLQWRDEGERGDRIEMKLHEPQR